MGNLCSGWCTKNEDGEIPVQVMLKKNSPKDLRSSYDSKVEELRSKSLETA